MSLTPSLQLVQAMGFREMVASQPLTSDFFQFFEIISVTDFVQYWFPLAVLRDSLAVEVSHLPPFRSEDELDCRFVYAPLCDCSAASVHDCADVLHGVVGATCLEKNGRKGTESKAAQILLAVQVPVSEAGTIFRRRSPAATGRFQ
jgi:hypothetical protein